MSLLKKLCFTLFIPSLLYAAEQRMPGNIVAKFNQAAALGQSPIIMDRHKALGLYQELLDNEALMPDIYKQGTRLNMALILNQHSRLKENKPNCAQRGVQLLEPLLRTEEPFISSDLLKHAASLTAHFYQCLNNKPREQFYRAWLLGESVKTGDKQKAVNLLKNIIQSNKDDPYYYCQARINLAQLFCLQLHPNRPIDKKRKFANQGRAPLEPLVISNGLTVTPEHKVQAWDCMAEFYNYEQDQEKAVICDLNVIAETWDNGLEQYCQGAYERAMGHFAQMCVHDKKWKQAFNERFNDTGIGWVHFCKRAESFEIPDGTYLLAEHKIDCNTKGSLQKAEKMLQTLIDEQYDQAVPALIYTKWKLSQDKDDEKPQETKKEAQKKSKLSKNKKKKQIAENKKQKEKRKKEAQEMITSLVAQPERIDACITYFQERADDIGPQFVWRTIYMYPANENSLRWKAAFELYKHEKDSKKRNLYLMLAAQHGHKEAMFAYGKQLKGQTEENRQKAKVMFEQLAGKGNKWAAYHRGLLSNEFKEAVKWFEPLIDESDPELAAHALVSLAKEYEEEAKELKKNNKMKPKLRDQLAKRYRDKAIQLYQKAERDDLNLLHLGYFYLRDENYPESRRYLESFIKKHPKHADALFNLGFGYLKENKFEQAQKYLLDSYTIDHNSSAENSILVLMRILKQQNRRVEARDVLFKAYKINPESARLQSHVGVHYNENGDLQGALAMFEQAAKKGCVIATINAGLTYYEQKRYQKAKPLLEQAVIKVPDYAQIHYCLGRIHGIEEHFTTSRDYYHNGSLLEDAESLYALAYYVHKGIGGYCKLEEAHELYERAARKFKEEKSVPKVRVVPVIKDIETFAQLAKYQQTDWTQIVNNPKRFVAAQRWLHKLIENNKNLKNEAHIALGMMHIYLAMHCPHIEAIETKKLSKAQRKKQKRNAQKSKKEKQEQVDKKKEHLKKALEYFDPKLHGHSNPPLFLYALCNFCLIEPEYDNLSSADLATAKCARDLYGKIICQTMDKDPHNHFLLMSYNNLGRLYFLIYQDREMTKKTFLDGIAHGSSDCAVNLGRCYEVGFFGAPSNEEAKKWYKKALEIDPTCAQARKVLALLNLRLGKVEENDNEQKQFLEMLRLKIDAAKKDKAVTAKKGAEPELTAQEYKNLIDFTSMPDKKSNKVTAIFQF